MEEKSRQEIIMRAKITYAEHSTNLSLRAWVNRELAELGMSPITASESEMHNLTDLPRMFQDV